MTNLDYLIGSPLKGISMIVDQELEGEELCLDQVQLFFWDHGHYATAISRY